MAFDKLQVLGYASPDPMVPPRVRRLSVDASLAGEDGLMSTILPQDLIISLLAERLLVRILCAL